MSKRTSLIRRVLVLGASVLWIMIFMGSLCEDILGVPVFFEDNRRMDLSVDTSVLDLPTIPLSTATLATVKDNRGDSDIPELGDNELPDLTDDLDIPDNLEDLLDGIENLDQLFESLEIDFDMGQVTANLPACDADLDHTVAGKDCICTTTGDNGQLRILFADGCLLGSMPVDIISQSSEIKKLKKYISGIYIRKVRYIVQAQDLDLSLPPLDIDVRSLIKTDSGAYQPDGQWVEMGASEGVEAGKRNTFTMGLQDEDYCELLDIPSTDAAGKDVDCPQEFEDRLLDCGDSDAKVCDSCTEATAACQTICNAAGQFQCADIKRIRMRMSKIDEVSEIFKSLLFEVRVSIGDDGGGNDITEEMLLILNRIASAAVGGDASSINLRLQLRLKMEMVVIVVPS